MANQLIKSLIGTFGLLTSGYSGSACAQTVMFDNFLPSFVDTNLRNQVLWEPYRSNSNNQKSTIRSTQRLAKFSFKAALDQRKANLANFVSKVRAKDRTSAMQMEEMFASSDVIAAIGQGLAPFGLRVDNVADAYTAYWMSAWQATVGRTDDFQRSEVMKVKSQVQLALLAVPQIVNATNAQKQEFAEALLVQTALIEASMEQAAGKPDQLRAVANAVRQGASAMGLDLDSMTLTEDGFVPSGKETGAAETENDTQLAAAPVTPIPNNSDSTNYALIAAAGGAGLGGMFLLGKVIGRKN